MDDLIGDIRSVQEELAPDDLFDTLIDQAVGLGRGGA